MTSLLSACGSGSSETSATGQTTPAPQPDLPTTPDQPPPDPTPTDPPTTPDQPTPDQPTPTVNIVPFDFIQLANNVRSRGDQVQAASFVNATGGFKLPLANQSLNGNLTISIDLADSDGINGVYVGFSGATKVMQLCAANCGTTYHQTLTGINPLDFNIATGNQRLELWEDDGNGNRTIVNTVNFTWRETAINGFRADRASNAIDLRWNPINSYLRYNVYIASQAGVTHKNYTSLPDGAAFLALRDPSHTLTGIEDAKVMFATVTGVDGSGESAFSTALRVDSLTGSTDLPPVAVNDNFSVNEDTVLTGQLLTNDSDGESNVITVDTAPIVASENGILVLNSNGTFTYTPTSNFIGPDRFTYQIRDGVGQTDTAEVLITVNQVNDAPFSSYNNYNLITDAAPRSFEQNAIQTQSAIAGTLNIAAPGLLINDLDIDSINLSVVTTPLTPPTQGTVELRADGSFTYTSFDGASGEDSFVYQTADNNGALSQAIVRISIDGNNFPPVAATERYNLNESQSFTADNSAADRLSILANDFDLDANDTITLTTTLIQSVSHGQLNMGTDGTFTYIPNQGYFGVDSFVYEITDSQGAMAQAAVLLTIGRENTAPNAAPDTYTLNEDSTLSVSAAEGLLANDTDIDEDAFSVNVANTQLPQNGELTLFNDGSFTYVPNENFFGSDSFSYEVIDSLNLASTGTVTLSITNINDIPIANDDTVLVPPNASTIINVLSNDSDIENNPLTVTQATATVGNVITNNNNTLTYTPPNGFQGAATVNYTISDGNGGSASAQVLITVSDQNRPPEAVADSYTLAEDQLLVVDGSTQPLLLANDSDLDGDPLTVNTTVQSLPQNGTVTLSADGSFSYQPTSNFFGNDSFDYEVNDGQGGAATATVSLTITAVNDPPIATDDILTTILNTLINIDVLINDTDVDNDSLTISNAVAINGNVTVETNQTLNYTPNTDFIGNDTINYTISDGNGGSDSASVQINVLGTNNNPIALDDIASTAEDNTVTIDVLSNDTDIDNDTLRISSATLNNVSDGTINFNNDNTLLLYTPTLNFNGTTVINYIISDGNGGSATAIVDVTITPVNDAPTATNDFDSTSENTPITINVLANDSDIDGDSLTIANAVANSGSVDVNNDNTLLYTPNLNFNGTDVINYTISDGNGGTDSAIVNVTVIAGGSNGAPIANNDVVTLPEDSTVNINALLNDTDPDGDLLSLTGGIASQGSVTLRPDNTFDYTPNADFNGSDVLAYTISDNNGGTAAADVIITVTPVNDNPVATADEAITAEDTAVIINVLSNDSDIDNETLVVTGAIAANGSVTTGIDNTLEYTPNADFNGEDVIDYTIGDNSGGTSASKVTVTITAVNDNPVAVDDEATTVEDTQTTISVLANDEDIDGDELTVVVNTVTNGGAVKNPDNTIAFTPQLNFIGTASIGYTVTDGNGGSASATVVVTVTATNDLPVAVDDIALIQEDTVTIIDVLANDSDPEGGVLTLEVTATTNGTATVTNNNTLSFTPTADFNGEAAINYTITDSDGGAASATVSITIVAVNDNPVAVADEIESTEDSSNTIEVLSNDTDVDGDTLTVTGALAEHGLVTVNEEQGLFYIPDLNYNGLDTITYQISDGNGGSASSSVVVTLVAVNDAPEALDDQILIDEDIVTTINVLTNDSDVDGDTLNIVSADSANGAVSTITENGSLQLRFVPTANFNGETTINYLISDNGCSTAGSCGDGHSASAVVAVTVNSVNDRPVIADATTTVAENAINGFAITTVEATDADADTLSFSITSGNTDSIFAIDASSGQLTVADKTFLDFETTSSYALTVTVSDNQLTAAGIITINVTEISENAVPTPDSSFGNTPIAGLAASNAFAFDNDDVPHDAVIDSSGRVIIVGTVSNTTTDVTVSRYLADGHLDHSFGIQGIVTQDLGAFESAKAIAVDSNNNLFIAAEQFNAGVNEIALIKLLGSNGSTDNNFGTSGVVISSNNQNNVTVADILVHSNGSVLLAAGVNNQFNVFKYNASSGSVELSNAIDITGDFDQPQAMAEQSDGKVIIAGFTADPANGLNYDFAAARISADDLNLDTTFAGNGQTSFDLGQRQDDMPYDTRITSNGDIILAGSSELSAGIGDVALAVLDSSGSLKTSIGTGGIVIIDADGDNGAQTGNSAALSLTLDSSDNMFIGVQFGITATEQDFGVSKLSASGTLDNTFASNGTVIQDINNDSNTLVSVMLDSSNRPVAATSAQGSHDQDFALARFTTSGALDSTFLGRGYNLSNQSPSDDTLHDGIELAVGSHSGKLIMTGWTTSNTNTRDLIVARYNSNGSLDTSFAVDGYFKLSDSSATDVLGQSVAELSDGRLLIAGQFGAQGLAVMLDTDGKLDSSFDSDGLQLLSVTSQQVRFNSVAIDHNNKIVLGGDVFNPADDNIDLYLARLNLDGSLDTSFSSSGINITNLGQAEGINNLTVLADNTIIAVGRQLSISNEISQALVAKFLSNGALDSSGFNSGQGYQILDVDSSVGDNSDILYDVAVATDGTIYASGASNSTTTELTVVVSLSTNGALNSNFATNGLGLYNFGSGHTSQSLALDSNGKLLLSGQVSNATAGGNDIYLARLDTSGIADPLFNNGNVFNIHFNQSDSVSLILPLSDGRVLLGGHNSVTGYPGTVWYLAVYSLIQ